MTTPNSPDSHEPDRPEGTPAGGPGPDAAPGGTPSPDSGQPPQRPQPRYGQYSQPEQPPAPPHAGQQPGAYGQQSGQPGTFGQGQQYGQGQYGPGTGQAGQQPGPYGQGQYGQGQYGQTPYGYQAAQPSGYAYPGGPAAQSGPKGPPPREVMMGFWLILAAGVLAFINNLVTSFNLPDLLTPAQIQDLRQANIDVQDISGFMVTFSVVIALIGLGLYVLIALFVRKGHNWARIVGTVFAALSFFGLLVSLPAYFTSALGLLSLLSTLLGIAGIVMLYLKPSNAYFQRQQFNPYRPY
ncbi:hypothetical protein H9639_10135 [Arthrobacter sp. Sa2CUA1]|uniref:Uncharacterized protein n=1 Tax=Arthrobacter gallicola TaxID=2762225 RepID=A0ABR8UTF1_9MICC|nr:hypothetical protein [Arthrobacter gallicola]MBD7995655.1 hypothetical protein [Arthrobacter gallicola]